jgi:hypothetical protein
VAKAQQEQIKNDTMMDQDYASVFIYLQITLLNTFVVSAL